MKSAVDKNTSVFLDGDLSHAETQRRREGGSPASAIPFDRSSWKRVRLGEMLSLSDGDWIESKDQSESGHRLIQTGNIGEGVFEPHNERSRFISTETFNRLKCTEVFPGDCLISRLPDPIGRACILPDTNVRMITAVDCAIARPVDNRIDMRFFVSYTSTSDYKKQMERSLMGSTRQRISRKSLNDATISLPDVDTQKRIVSSLSAIDTQIAALQALISKYEAIKKATVNLLMTNKAGWHRLRIKDVAQVYDGTHQTPHYTNSGIPFFSVENVTTNTFPGRKRISLEEHRKLTAKFQLRRGDVLMTRIGSIGDCRIVDWDYPSSFYVSLAAIHLNTEMVLPEFFVAYSKTKEFQEEVKIRSLPFAVPQKINLGPISQIQICVPALKRQREIAAQISAIDDALKKCHAKLAKAQSLKQGMMSYFFG